MIKDILSELERTERELGALSERKEGESGEEMQRLGTSREELLQKLKRLEPGDRVFLARHPKRPHVEDFIAALFTDFFEQRGDHLFDEDRAVYGGIARFHGQPVTVLGTRKGRTVQENMECNFGMPRPEGYRKALRIMRQAEKFGRPILSFIDTPGAYPGLEAEAHGQGEAIAKNLAAMSAFHVPILSLVTGEGNSGGALGIGVSNKILMLENAVYSVLSPEGFATILWKDASLSGEAAKVMKLTAEDLLRAGVADSVIPEPVGGAQRDPEQLYRSMDRAISEALSSFRGMSPSEIREQRFEKYRAI